MCMLTREERSCCWRRWRGQGGEHPGPVLDVAAQDVGIQVPAHGQGEVDRVGRQHDVRPGLLKFD
jgi:hypothetical protein